MDSIYLFMFRLRRHPSVHRIFNIFISKLAFSNQSSYFYPSVGLSAVLTEMFARPKIISYAKVRGSYTVVASSFDRYLTNPGYEDNSQTHNWANPTV